MLPPALQERGVSSTALPQVSLGHCCAICAHFTQHNTLHAATRTNPALFTLTWPGFASVASPAAVRTSPPVPAGGTRNLGQGEQHWGLFISALTLGCLRASSPEGQLREKGHLSAAFLFQSPATPHCHGSVATTQGQGGGWGLMGRAAKELLLLQNRGEVSTAVMGRHRKRVWAAWLKGRLSQAAPLPCPGCPQASPEHSPGVWHSADGTPRKGGLRWGPRAMWGAFWGDSRGGGWDISLQQSENKAMLKTWRLQRALAQEQHLGCR